MNQKQTKAICLLFLVALPNALALEINYGISAQPEYYSKLTIKTIDQNVYVDVNKLEALLGNKLLQKKDFLCQRVGEFEIVLSNESFLQAKKLVVSADYNNQSFEQGFDLNVVKDNNLIGIVKHEIPQQQTSAEQALDWLQQTAWDGLILDNPVILPNWGLIVCISIFVLVVLKFGKLI